MPLTPGSGEIGAGAGVLVQATPKTLGKKRGSQRPLARARTRDDFAATARERLRYHLPDVKLTAEGLRHWLPKLDLTERQYEKLIDMRLEDSVRANAGWPLVAWLGVVLELGEDTG